MAKRTYVKVSFSAPVFDPATGEITVTGHYKGLSATSTKKSKGNAEKHVREQLRAMVEAGEVKEVEKPQHQTQVVTPTPNLDPTQLFALMAQFMQNCGLGQVQAQAPVTAPAPAPTSVPTPEPKASAGLIGPNDEHWHRVRLNAIRVVGPKQKEAQKARKGSFGPNLFKSDIDQLMAENGCEPVYNGRTQLEIKRINVKSNKAFKAIRAEEKKNKALWSTAQSVKVA